MSSKKLEVAKSSLSRITIDMPKIDHKKLKAIAAVTGKSMRAMVLEFIDDGLSHYNEEKLVCNRSHVPNKKTIRAIKDSENEKNLVKIKNARDIFKKLGM